MSVVCLSKIDNLIEIFSRSGCYSKYPFKSIKKIRELLSMPNVSNKFIHHVIERKVIPNIIKLLKHNNYNFKMLCYGYIRELNLKYQVPKDIIHCIDRMSMIHCINDKRWMLIAISSGTSQQTKYIVDNGAIPILMDGIKQETSILIKTNSIQALGNIAGHGVKYRDLVLEQGVLHHILSIVKNMRCHTIEKRELLELTAWTLKNLCCGIPGAEWKYNSLIIEALQMLINYNDEEILRLVSESLCNLSQIQNNQQIQAIINGEFVPKLIKLLDLKYKSSILQSVLCIFGNIAGGTDQDTQYLLDCGVLTKLDHIFDHIFKNDIDINKQTTLKMLSNITAGSVQHIEMVIKTDLFPKIINILENEEEYDIALEALWVISNASFGTDQQIKFMVDKHVMRAICNFIKRIDKQKQEDMMVTLEAIENILDFGNRNHEKYKNYIEQFGCVQCLKLWNKNEYFKDEVKKKANVIITKYLENNKH